MGRHRRPVADNFCLILRLFVTNQMPVIVRASKQDFEK